MLILVLDVDQIYAYQYPNSWIESIPYSNKGLQVLFFSEFTCCGQTITILQLLTDRPIWFVRVLLKAYMHYVQAIGIIRQVIT